MLKFLRLLLRYEQVIFALFLALFLYGTLSLASLFYGPEVFDVFIVASSITLTLYAVFFCGLFAANIALGWLRDIADAAEAQNAPPAPPTTPTVEAPVEPAAEGDGASKAPRKRGRPKAKAKDAEDEGDKKPKKAAKKATKKPTKRPAKKKAQAAPEPDETREGEIVLTSDPDEPIEA
jgi:hypothetical protein